MRGCLNHIVGAASITVSNVHESLILFSAAAAVLAAWFRSRNGLTARSLDAWCTAAGFDPDPAVAAAWADMAEADTMAATAARAAETAADASGDVIMLADSPAAVVTAMAATKSQNLNLAPILTKVHHTEGVLKPQLLTPSKLV